MNPSFGPTSNGMSIPGVPSQTQRKRCGVFAARIGSDHHVKFSIAAPRRYRNGQVNESDPPIPAGMKQYVCVEDISRHPEVKGHVRWHCTYCRQDWSSKEELVAAHPDNRVLQKQEEAHMYYALAEVPEIKAVAAKTDEKGKIISPAVAGQPAITLLLSDEE